MSRKLTILFAPLDCVGMVNSLTGIGQVMRERGHRIVFVVTDIWKNKLKVHGFEEEIITLQGEHETEDPAKYYALTALNAGQFGPKPAIDKLKAAGQTFFKHTIEWIKESHNVMTEIVDRVKPDIIVNDNYIFVPAFMNTNIPWVLSVSTNVLIIDLAVDDEKIPPSCLGLPTNGNPEEWKRIREEIRSDRRDIWKDFNEWLINNSCEPLPRDMLLIPSPFLNIYMFPEEVDYKGIIPSNWHQIDCLVRTEISDAFEIPEKLRKRSGKLIYFSLGSMGGIDLQLIKRLVSIMSKSKHRFIVSKGPLSDQYELPDNMWGERTVPQTKVMPIVDLVITHGGNNTFIESFFFGKPMIVMPLFFDQYDNAQRIEESGLGIRLDPYKCSDHELLESIDKMIGDERLSLKFKQISERIKSSNLSTKVAKMIENMIK